MRRRFKLLILAAVCLALSLSLLGIKAMVVSDFDSQDMAGRWQTDTMNYSQLTWFLPESAAFTTDSAASWRRSIDSAYAAEAIVAESDSARLWIDCYSSEGKVIITNGSTSITARAIVTGGDFFAFHPLELMSGWYYSDDDLMDDRVILDKNLAWQLFGGYDLEGMDISINGQYCLVAGVCDLPEKKAEADAYTDNPTVYLPASLMQRVGGSTSITCYEVVAPNPVSGFAADKVGQALAFSDGEYEFVENTSRFNFVNSLRVAADFGTRSQRITDIYFPWWENAARYMEAWCALFVLAACVLMLVPVIFVIGCVCCAIVKRDKVFDTAVKFIRRIRRTTGSSDSKEESQ